MNAACLFCEFDQCDICSVGRASESEPQEGGDWDE